MHLIQAPAAPACHSEQAGARTLAQARQPHRFAHPKPGVLLRSPPARPSHASACFCAHSLLVHECKLLGCPSTAMHALALTPCTFTRVHDRCLSRQELVLEVVHCSGPFIAQVI